MPAKKSTYQADDDAVKNDNHLDPLIEAMLEHLPDSGEPFPNQKLWMDILTLVLKLVYPPLEGQVSGGPT